MTQHAHARLIRLTPVLTLLGLMLAGCAQAPTDDPAYSKGLTTAPITAEAKRPRRSPTTPTTAPDLSRNRERETSSQVLAYPTGERETSVILLEKRFPTQARLGQIYKYELKVTNLTSWPVSGVTVREDFPASFIVHPADGLPAADNPNPATQPTTVPTAEPAALPTAPTPLPSLRDVPELKYVQGIGYVRDVSGTWWGTATRRERRGIIAQEFIVGMLEPKQSKIIPVAGISDELGKLDTRTTVTYTPVLAGGTDVINPILKLAKEGPRHADLCETIEYRYVISNIGVGTETEVRIDDTLPDGLLTAEGKKVVSFAVGDLPQNQRKEFVAKLKAARTGEFTGRAQAKGFGTAAQSSEVVTAVHAPKLTLAVTGPESEYVGKAAAYELVVTNSGDAAARNTVVSAAADAGTQVLWMNDAASATAERQIIGTIEPGQSRKVRVAARPSVGGVMTLRATAKSDCADAVAAQAKTTVQTIASLVMEVTDRDDPLRVGDSTVYKITVKNQGSGADRNVKITATLPAQLQFIAATGPTPGAADGQKIVFDTLPRLDPGQSASWLVEVKAIRAGDARFGAALTSESLAEPVIETQPTHLY